MFFAIFGRQNGTGRSPSPAITGAGRVQVEAECKGCGAAAGYWCLTAAGMPASAVCPERAVTS